MQLKNLEQHNQDRRKQFQTEAEKKLPPKRNGFECPNCHKEMFDVVDDRIKKEMEEKRKAGALVKQPVRCSCGYRSHRCL